MYIYNNIFHIIKHIGTYLFINTNKNAYYIMLTAKMPKGRRPKIMKRSNNEMVIKKIYLHENDLIKWKHVPKRREKIVVKIYINNKKKTVYTRIGHI